MCRHMNSVVYAIHKHIYAGIKEKIAICQHSEILESPWKKQKEKILLFSSKSSIDLWKW